MIVAVSAHMSYAATLVSRAAVTVVCLRFHPMVRKHMHALKGLACRKRVAAASSPAATCKQGAALTSRLRDTLAAAPGLLAHASVTEVVNFCPMGPKFRHTMVAVSDNSNMHHHEPVKAHKHLRLGD